MNRAIRPLLATAVVASLTLTACSKAEDAATDAAAAGSSVAAAAQSATNDAGEVTIEHARGTDTYKKNPSRVVAIGPAIDNLLELGITPAAVVVTPKDVNSPWRDGRLDGVTIINQTDFKSVPKEEIAAVDPDFIVGDFWSISPDNYTTLSAIAPTLGGIGTSGEEIGWKPQIKALGTIFDKEAEADKVIAADKERFEEMKKKLPGLKDKTGVVSQYARGSFGAVADPSEPGASFIYDLGMTFPQALTDGSVPIENGRVTLSPENVGLLAADFMVIYNRGGDMAEVEATPGYDALPQVTSGATNSGNEAVVAGLNVPTSLSRAWVLEQVTPQLEKAAQG
ncbi:ABC transporter substrate-binding protein [Corynebacterium sp. 13CS0277]|uniref:ABC transporter substrate-binding protein n=1 Tax=Corynebacterium sp. 13CS0277 TaxID=2071994 RepID=UPI000D0260B6|nr:ABC transporter substrate-binding protein [Corynebacterium sp. 13CS0277]PRQ10962.1 ABC transporter substrate-binding protein [Corynebacterium sp. 13CS0277]